MQAVATEPQDSLPSVWSGHSFRIYIAVLFAVLIFAVSAALVWSNYVQGRNMMLQASEDVFERVAREMGSEVQRLRTPIESAVDWLSRVPLTNAETHDDRMRSLELLAEALNRHPPMESIYIGYFNGDFFQLHALRDEAARKRFGAPRHAAYRLQSIERAKQRVRFLLYDAALNAIDELPIPAGYSFDPRARPWYEDAMRSTEQVQTAPYLFFTTQEAGVTFARRAEHGRAVVGADIALKQLSQTLTGARPSPSSQLVLFAGSRRAIAQSEPLRAAPTAGKDAVLPMIADLSPVFAAAVHDAVPQAGQRSVDVDGREWLVRVAPAAHSEWGTIYLAVATPGDELLTAARAALQRNLWLALALILLTVPLTWWIARRIAAKLNALTEQAAAIRRFDFNEPAPVATPIIEIQDLGLAMTRMRETIRKFVAVTTALSAERNFDRLLRSVLFEARDAAGADGGVIYLVDDDGRTLRPAGQSWSDDAARGPEGLPECSREDATHPVARAARGEAALGTHALGMSRPAGLEYLDARCGREPVVLVTVALRERGGATIGVLCVFVKGSVPPSPARLALVEAFAGAGAAAIDNQRLLAAQKAMFNSLIGLIAGAIDAKSHYTAGHCQRVPELTNMLARAACEAKEGPFADFDLDEEQWEALHIAGGLHDCGKVTTPEYVVDKATKLETIYDRIHEVRMRFEVLKRDAEIACLKAIAAGGNDQERRDALERELRALDEEFVFVAGCNEGGEFMAPAKVERLKSIARRTWQRTLDDRIGISWVEAERKSRVPAPSLPVTEQLLADKPEHVIEREAGDILKPDNPWGFKLSMPAALYNQGELYNLAVARGTLTDEERYKINDHIMQTIIMLSALPFPRHLKAVPELAGGHHEKMDGTGYPKRLRREDMSIPARIMAIADIFEALTASDRPYKKAKTLSESIKIMGFMKKDRHIDPELFDLFLTSGVYRRYADRFMAPEYIDEVNVKTYVGAPS